MENTSPQIALKVDRLCKTFRTDFYKPKILVLNNVSFEVQSGHFVGFIGPNGAGKTTTIKCLLEFIFPDSGEIQFLNESTILKAKKRIGFVPERPYFHEYLSGLEFLNLHWSLCGLPKKDFANRAQEVLELVKLAHAQNKKLREYSKGMLQRIGIAQALLGYPEFLILDEPMSGLDPDGRILVKDILKSLKGKNITVLMSSHLLEDVEELCEDLVIIQKGAILYNGALKNFTGQYASLEEAYRSFKQQVGVNYNA